MKAFILIAIFAFAMAAKAEEMSYFEIFGMFAVSNEHFYISSNKHQLELQLNFMERDLNKL